MKGSGLRAYFDLVYQESDCYATWLPGTPIALGEIGRISENGSFQRTGSVSGRAEMPPARSLAEPDQIIGTSGGVTFAAGGKVATEDVVDMLAAVDAKLVISFERSAAAAMVLQDVVRHEFEDERAVREVMRSLHAEGRIDEDEVVVTYVKSADSGVVATTFDAEKGVDVAIDARLGTGVLTLAKVGGQFQLASLKSSNTVVTAQVGRPLTPMYRALVFRHNRRWWSFWGTQLEIGSAIPSRHFGGPEDDLIAPSRPSLVTLPADAGER